MQKKIDHLKKKLRCARRRRTPSLSDPSSEGSQGSSYRPRALHQISRSPFSRRIEKGKLPRQFTQPTFTIYNGRTDPVEHDVGHTTENCRTLWNHLEQLVSEGKLKQFLCHPNGQGSHSGSINQRNNSSRPPLGTINVIFAAPSRTGSCPTRVISVSHILAKEFSSRPKRIKGGTPPILSFSDEDNVGTIQPYDDALVVTLRIRGYDVKRVMVDQGSGANIMYPDLFKGLNLKLEDLTPYDSPLISFEGKAVIPKGQIRLPVQSGPKTIDVNFIVVDAYSPYTAIVTKPWLHALGVVSSTLHVKAEPEFSVSATEDL
ncbi:uncharacterized protein LOC142632617 [Castanea sativa]|uniref:uncharacterized protein LOC142632617 n=1 Tax=Castanea sativa TaxID=21020 RepID=UPI003F64C6A0